MGSRRRRVVLVAGVVGSLAMGCGTSAGNSPPPVPPCDQACQDGIAVRSLREGMKLLYNLELQGKPVGPQDAMVPCPLGGTAHVFGTATSNAVQGATEVQLTYTLDHCRYSQTDTDPVQNYSVTIHGTVQQSGTIAVQPSATTALVITSDVLDVMGTVHEPALDYTATACKLALGQTGSKLSGELCGRKVGVTL